MATQQNLEQIAARIFPDHAPGDVLSQKNLFLARVMSAGDWDEVKLVEDQFGRAALRSVLDAPPSKIFDRPSWSLWHAAFELETREMPENFFTIYPWFKERAMQVKQEKTAETIGNLKDYRFTPVRSCDEMQTA